MTKFNGYIKEVIGTTAFWVTPKGETVAVNRTHIQTVIDSPKKFGLTREKIDAVYKTYNEPIGQEGKAREEIMVDLIKKGYLRVRRYGREGYSINIPKMTNKIKDILFDFANKMITTGVAGYKERDKYQEVHITGLSSPVNIRLSLLDIAQDKLYEGDEKFDPENSVIIVESAEDFTYEPKLLDGQRCRDKEF
jgi:hypothetical protein